MVYVLFLLGFVFLIRGAEWLINGASILAKRIGVSELIIGLTVVAFGTSLPELIVNLFAGGESADLAIGNVLGSNIANTLLILGVAAIIKPLTIRRVTVYREVFFNFMATILLAVLVSERLLSAGGFDGLDRIDGIVLMSYFVIFLYYAFGRNLINPTRANQPDLSDQQFNLAGAWLKVLAGSVGLFFGGRWIVDGALSIADLLSVGDQLVAVTIVALGTSLPELAASVIAIRTTKTDIAVGNIVGSNLFNIFWVLGLSAYVNPLPFNDALLSDVLITFASGALLLVTMLLGGKRHQITHREGILFVVLYVAYIVFAIFRG